MQNILQLYFRQKWSTQQLHGLFATAKLLVNEFFCQKALVSSANSLKRTWLQFCDCVCVCVCGHSGQVSSPLILTRKYTFSLLWPWRPSLSADNVGPSVSSASADKPCHTSRLMSAVFLAVAQPAVGRVLSVCDRQYPSVWPEWCHYRRLLYTAWEKVIQ